MKYPDGKTVTYTFNANNWLIGVQGWGTGNWAYVYDAAGRLLTATLPNNIATGYRYDTANHLLGSTTRNTGWVINAYTYTLDALGNRLAAAERVLPPTPLTYMPIVMKNYSGTQGMAPQSGLSSPFVSPLAVPQPFDSPLSSGATSPNGASSGGTTPFPFDPSLLIMAPIALAAVVASRKKGRKWALPVALLVGSLVAIGSTQSSVIGLQSSAVGGLRSTVFSSPLPPPPGCTLPTSSGDTRVISYTYDPLYRLSQAAYSSGECYQYGYDQVGNRMVQTTTVGATTYQYDAANRLTNAGGVNYTWDNAGNLRNDGSSLYRYDQASRLISMTQGSKVYTFNYNGDSARLKQVVNGAVTTYTQDLAASLPVVLQSKTVTATTQYVYDMDTSPLAQSTAGAWQYLLPDALGSVRQIADANGNVIRTQDYDPYGNVLNGSGQGSSPYGFTGEERDGSGLIFLRARYMQSQTGIFLSHDPWEGDMMRPGSMNGWNYTEGNPVNYTDPTGRFAQPSPYYLDNGVSGAGNNLAPLAGRSSTCLSAKRSCVDIANDIALTIAELSQRGDELLHDPLDLPRIGQSMTVESHRRQFEAVQTHLRKLISEWNKNGCGNNPPGDAWKWATIVPPWPRPKLPGSKFEPVPVTEPAFSAPELTSTDIATGKTLTAYTPPPGAQLAGVPQGGGPQGDTQQTVRTAGQVIFWAAVIYAAKVGACVLTGGGCALLAVPIP